MPDVTEEEIQKVLELAEKATPGEWKQTGSKAHPHWNIAGPECLIHGVAMNSDGHIQETIDRWIADAAYMVAVQPAFVKRLASELLSLRKSSHSVSQCCPMSERLERENAELRAIVARLPKTADGVPITPGMITYCSEKNPFPHGWDMRLRSGETYADHCRSDNEVHFSTREAAAEASKRKVQP